MSTTEPVRNAIDDSNIVSGRFSVLQNIAVATPKIEASKSSNHF